MTVLVMVGDPSRDDNWPSRIWWMTSLGKLGEYPFDCGWPSWGCWDSGMMGDHPEVCGWLSRGQLVTVLWKLDDQSWEAGWPNFRLSNLNYASSTLLPPNSYLTQNVLKIAWFLTEYLQPLLAAFSMSETGVEFDNRIILMRSQPIDIDNFFVYVCIWYLYCRCFYSGLRLAWIKLTLVF